LLALITAGVGLFWQDGGGSSSFTTLRGQTVETYGRGLYRYDTLFVGAGNRGTDTVTLFLGIPLLVLSTLLYRRGSLRGGLVLTGALTWFLYVGASYALGAVAYNNLFLIYVALFSASLFAFVLALTSIDIQALPSYFASRMPRRGPAIFMFASGLLTLFVWLIEPITALIQGRPPEHFGPYSTLFTNGVDVSIIATEATRLAEERIREMFAVTEFDPDEVYGPMTSEAAADFLGLPYSSFREIAPSLPRHAVTPQRFVYLRRELLGWLSER
jgi:hypothetical protein